MTKSTSQAPTSYYSQQLFEGFSRSQMLCSAYWLSASFHFLARQTTATLSWVLSACSDPLNAKSKSKIAADRHCAEPPAVLSLSCCSLLCSG